MSVTSAALGSAAKDGGAIMAAASRKAAMLFLIIVPRCRFAADAKAPACHPCHRRRNETGAPQGPRPSIPAVTPDRRRSRQARSTRDATMEPHQFRSELDAD